MFDKEEKEEPRLIVSDKFIEIYKNFNVSNQIEKINELSDRERYLLFILCLDKHDDGNPIVLYNFRDFKKEIKEIYEIQDDKKTTVQALLELIEETEDKHIETNIIIDSNGNKVPDPFDIDEVRDKKIDIINN